MQCRLLQPPPSGSGGACLECGAYTIAPVELVRELLHYRDMRMGSSRDWGLATALLAGGALAVPLLVPFAVGSIIALAVHRLRGGGRRERIAGVALPPITMALGAKTLYGTARKFRSTVTSLADDTQVLIEHVVVRDRKGGVLLRRSEHAPFLLETVDGRSVLVTGVTRVSSPTFVAHSARVRRGDPRLHKLGVPDDLAIAGELEIASIGERSPVLAVTGVVEDEAVAELAFHRDGGLTPVMRGRSGAPVLVEDRRLIAALPARY